MTKEGGLYVLQPIWWGLKSAVSVVDHVYMTKPCTPPKTKQTKPNKQINRLDAELGGTFPVGSTPRIMSHVGTRRR